MPGARSSRTSRVGPVARYLEASRDGANALLLTVPLLLLYQAGLLLRRHDARNAADALIADLLAAFGRPATIVVNLLLALAFFLVAARRRKRAATPFGLILPVVLESACYAAALAPAVRLMAGRALAATDGVVGSTFDAAVMAVGAGFYEELVFRLAGVAGIFVVLRRALRVDATAALAVALAASATTFAAFHHVGPGSEPFTVAAFLFRTAAGLLLGILFVLRGFGVACYTHTLYNLMVLFG